MGHFEDGVQDGCREL